MSNANLTVQLTIYKVELVAQGCVQKSSIDYEETFSSKTHRDSFTTLLSSGVDRGMLIHQINMVTDFLSGTLTEEIYLMIS